MSKQLGGLLCGALLAVAGTASAASAVPQGSSALDAPDTAQLAGPGPIHASPTASTTDLPRGAAPALPSRNGRMARLLGNGTALNYGQGGANAIGYTGGLTTGPEGNAGAYAGGGGVHAGALVIPPGQVNATMRSDDPRERVPARPANADNGTGPSQQAPWSTLNRL